MSDTTNKKPRNYYVDYKKSRGGFRGGRGGRGGHANGSTNSRYRDTPDLAFGNRGFLITSVDEVKSYLEMRNIFEGYYYQLHDDSTPETGDAKEATNQVDVEDEIESELKKLRITKPFKQMKTQCKNNLFLNISRDYSHVDPVVMVDKFFDELAEKREIKTSNTFKVLPILDTFRCSVACAKESISKLLQTNLEKEEEEKQDEKKYFIELQSRGNYKLSPEEKQKMIEGIAEVITELRPNWKVSRENADYLVIVVALRNVCCITLLKDYFKRCKYNVIEFCKDFVPNSEPSDKNDNLEPDAEQVAEEQ